MSTLAPEERAHLLREYVQLDALSLMVGVMLECGPLEDIIAEEYHDAAGALAEDHFRRLAPPDDINADPEFARADAMSAILAGELLLALAAHRDWLLEEGRRLVSNGRGHLTGLDGLAA